MMPPLQPDGIDDEQTYDYRALAKQYARYLPQTAALDWEDIYQEMMLASFLYKSFKSMGWAANDLIKKE